MISRKPSSASVSLAQFSAGVYQREAQAKVIWKMIDRGTQHVHTHAPHPYGPGQDPAKGQQKTSAISGSSGRSWFQRETASSATVTPNRWASRGTVSRAIAKCPENAEESARSVPKLLGAAQR